VLAAVAPVFTYFFISGQLEGARYVYLAECGWALLVAQLMRTTTDYVTQNTLALACVAGAAIVTSSLTLEHELSVWRRAADLRDHVLNEAHGSILNGRCAVAHFSDVPDSVDGAYVFRNGFREALGLRGDEASPECNFTWNGGRFLPIAALR
jgi:hypothetical protein